MKRWYYRTVLMAGFAPYLWQRTPGETKLALGIAGTFSVMGAWAYGLWMAEGYRSLYFGGTILTLIVTAILKWTCPWVYKHWVNYRKMMLDELTRQYTKK